MQSLDDASRLIGPQFPGSTVGLSTPALCGYLSGHSPPFNSPPNIFRLQPGSRLPNQADANNVMLYGTKTTTGEGQ